MSSSWLGSTSSYFSTESYFNMEEKLINLAREANCAKPGSNFYLIRNEVLRDSGKFVTKNCSDIHDGILACAVSDEDDYYYLVINKERKVIYHSACGGYSIMDDSNISPNFSVLIWLQEHDPESLIDIVQSSIKRNGVLLMTPIKVRI